MGLSIGIAGLPNVGKSTLFNALTRQQRAEAANYPFCTIEANKATVPVTDARLDAIAAIVKPASTIHATVDFVDIAGLVRGASQGEGLGNQFLANIRETDAVLHVVRCFDDADITHVEGSVDPVRDAGIIETELILSDWQRLEKRMERLTRLARADTSMRESEAAGRALLAHLEQGRTVQAFPDPDAVGLATLRRDMQFLTDKPLIYCANVDEATIGGAPCAHVDALQAHAAATGARVVLISARIEAELAGLDETERAEFLASYGIDESGLRSTVRLGYEVLGLISYFTAGPKEARAWTIRRGTRAPAAAGVIHSDFERGFIRAQVIACDEFLRLGGEQACKAAGLMRQEGKDYTVQDGDVILFLFNV